MLKGVSLFVDKFAFVCYNMDLIGDGCKGLQKTGKTRYMKKFKAVVQLQRQSWLLNLMYQSKQSEEIYYRWSKEA